MVTAQTILEKEYPSIDEDAHVSKLLGLMQTKHIHWAVIVDKKGTYKGMTDKKWLLRSRIDVEHTKVKHCIVATPKLEPEDSEETMLNKFVTSDVKALPVFREKHILGVVPVSALLDTLKTRMKKVCAAELMPKTFYVLNTTDDCGKAINIMIQKKLHHIPVIDSASKKLVGIVSLIDLFERQAAFSNKRMHLPRAASHQPFKHTGYGVGEKTSILFCPITNVMSPDCCTGKPEDPIPTLIDRMRSDHHSTTIIVKDQIPVGIVTVKDILVKAQKLL